MKRVIGIGGIFFKSDDPKKLNDWYKQHLGMDTSEWGCVFESKSPEDLGAKTAQTIWNPFKATTDYFSPSDKPFMINYRVENLVDLMVLLRQEGVNVVGDMQEFPYGKFAWILDPEGNKIELWEPLDK